MRDWGLPGSSELTQRVLSGLVLGAVGLLALVIGGFVFAGFCAAAAGLMIWELTRLLWRHGPERTPVLNGSVAAISVLAAALMPFDGPVNWLIPAAAAVALAVMMRRGPILFAIYGGAILYATLVLSTFRTESGFYAAAWLILLVVATDTAAFACGRALGGPRLAPKISPGKRWSGALGGGAAAVAVTVAFAGWIAAPVIALGIALSAASQCGDLAESWIKRRAGVKDSSGLIPGHGGALDRLDGLTGACALFGILEVFRVAERVGIA